MVNYQMKEKTNCLIKLIKIISRGEMVNKLVSNIVVSELKIQLYY